VQDIQVRFEFGTAILINTTATAIIILDKKNLKIG